MLENLVCCGRIYSVALGFLWDVTFVVGSSCFVNDEVSDETRLSAVGEPLVDGAFVDVEALG